MEEQLHLESQQMEKGLKETSYPSLNSGLFCTKRGDDIADFLVSARPWRGGENAFVFVVQVGQAMTVPVDCQ